MARGAPVLGTNCNERVPAFGEGVLGGQRDVCAGADHRWAARSQSSSDPGGGGRRGEQGQQGSQTWMAPRALPQVVLHDYEHAERRRRAVGAAIHAMPAGDLPEAHRGYGSSRPFERVSVLVHLLTP